MTQAKRHCPDPANWLARLAANTQVDETTGCHLWTGRMSEDGYGKFRVYADAKSSQTGAHRAAWLATKGDIPEGLVVDHLCRVRNCVNPDHMELVTNDENLARGVGLSGGERVPLEARVGCGRHGKSDGYWRVNRQGYDVWACRPCQRAGQERYKARRAAKAALCDETAA